MPERLIEEIEGKIEVGPGIPLGFADCIVKAFRLPNELGARHQAGEILGPILSLPGQRNITADVEHHRTGDRSPDDPQTNIHRANSNDPSSQSPEAATSIPLTDAASPLRLVRK